MSIAVGNVIMTKACSVCKTSARGHCGLVSRTRSRLDYAEAAGTRWRVTSMIESAVDVAGGERRPISFPVRALV